MEVENVYSDSLDHDRYIFALGKHCYLANKGELKEIDFEKEIKAYDEAKSKKKSKKNQNKIYHTKSVLDEARFSFVFVAITLFGRRC